MSFIWPRMLVLLLAVPFARRAGYVSLVRRRAVGPPSWPPQGFAPTAAARRLRRLRHLPFVFFLARAGPARRGLRPSRGERGLPAQEGHRDPRLRRLEQHAGQGSRSRRGWTRPRRRPRSSSASSRAPSRSASSPSATAAWSTQQPTTRPRPTCSPPSTGCRPTGGTSLGQGIFTSLSAIAGKPIASTANATATTSTTSTSASSARPPSCCCPTARTP